MIILRHKANPIDEILAIFNRIQGLRKQDADKIAAAVRAGHAANFSGQRSGSGAPFAPLKPSTVAQRQRLGFSGSSPILIRDGSFMRSFTDPGSPNHVSDVVHSQGKVSIISGSRDPRAGPLGDGTDRMPARPVADLSTSAKSHVGDTIVGIINLLAKNGR